MVSPAFTTSRRSTARSRWQAVKAWWTAFRTRNREVLVTYGISLTLHAALFLMLGTALFHSGDDDADLPELSVQLVTREGPSSETFTEAALPRPVPEPEEVEELLDDPGTGTQVIDAPAMASNQPVPEETPLDAEAALESALAQQLPQQANVLTTTGESDTLVGALFDPAPAPEIAVPEAEQVMLTRNVQQLAQRLLDTNLTDSELSWQQDGQQYSARVMRQPAPDSTGLEQVIAEVTTDKDGKRMKTRLSLKRLAFSHFAQLVNHWDPNIMLHDDVIDGRFHSNTEIGIAFSRGVQPRFFGKVTTAAAHLTRDDTVPRKRSKDVFQGGIETRTERVSLPRDMPEVVSGGEQDDRVVFTEDTRIIFQPDGTYMWRAANGSGVPTVRSRSTRPMYLIGEDGAKLFVRGTVSGIYTVYSPADIEIEDDLTYSKDPRDTVISGDYLALISGRDVRISGARITGAGDLHIHAAIFARRRFVIEAVNHGKNGRLMILGSLTAGTILETEPRYATQLDFDKRFEYLRPASFPMTRRYEVDSWDLDWREVAGPEIQPERGLARSE